MMKELTLNEVKTVGGAFRDDCSFGGFLGATGLGIYGGFVRGYSTSLDPRVIAANIGTGAIIGAGGYIISCIVN